MTLPHLPKGKKTLTCVPSYISDLNKSGRCLRSGESSGILGKIYILPNQIQAGNIEWCKTCQTMMTKPENPCCREGNAILDEFFQDKFRFFNNC